ncbi:hypothetical protein CAP42_03970 [Acinetobacter indicus]|nr:hypothetical protein VH96_03745 [Acinetobacter indicus]OUY10895.1 hypothetical protein CAP42_03970 [Acinetobacter indicus]
MLLLPFQMPKFKHPTTGCIIIVKQTGQAKHSLYAKPVRRFLQQFVWEILIMRMIYNQNI